MAAERSSRPRRSRLGLFLVLLLGAVLAFELIDRVSPATPPRRTLSRVLLAGWRGGAAGAPSEEELGKNAFRPLPYVMYGLKPDFERDTAKDGKTRTSNSDGFRGREIVRPKPAGVYRIVCLGGSTTYSDPVGDEHAYPKLLEDVLRERRPDLQVEVINAGVPSYTTAETLPSLAYRCLAFEPDAIVLYEGINDYRVRTYGNFDEAYVHYRKIWDGGTRLYEIGEGEMAGGINPLIQHNKPRPNGDEQANLRQSGTHAFARNLESIIGVARAHRIQPVLVTCAASEPNPYTTKEFIAGIEEMNEAVRRVGEEQEVPVIDMGPAYPRAGHFVDPVHMNEEGSLVMATLIADGLLEALW